MGIEILMHSDTDVKVWVASCLSEIARIMALNAPYSDEEMKFLDTKSCSQPDARLSDMERIMTLIVEESEECSFELPRVLLKSVKRKNQNISPLSWEFGQKVLKNCADILRYDIPRAVNSIGIALNDFAEIVASICQLTPKTDCGEKGQVKTIEFSSKALNFNG
ncbi:hypothetical protein POM88_039549 [Heracleum sosnowskyi]|uniref:Uncharacterized protein n=1 Tax=Heracleum sosnowskyi TaxID=360622 RepID=A0AAD8HD04_9APIA|nr:hypothetical protein POM88_039549 [Heracleum sosnowskyi]